MMHRWLQVVPAVTSANRIHHLNPPPSAPIPAKKGADVVGFPIRESRPLTEAEAAEVRRIANLTQFQYRGEMSLNRLTVHVYGAKNTERLAWVKAALYGEEEDDSFGSLDLTTDEGRAVLEAMIRNGEIRLPDVSGLVDQ